MIKFLDGNHDSINQKIYYHGLNVIKGWWFFNSEEKSRIEAESKGYFYTKENSELASAILRFNFFKNDYKNTEQYETTLIDKFNNQMPYISDFNLFFAENHYPEPEIGKNLGVKNIKESEILKTKYILSEIIFNIKNENTVEVVNKTIKDIMSSMDKIEKELTSNQYENTNFKRFKTGQNHY